MLIVEKKLIQGPLAGYSCSPFREMAMQWGKPDFCYSEMLSAQHIASGAPLRKRYMYKSPHEGKLCVQLASDRPEELCLAAEKAVTWGADFIDLNCGCPQPKIRKKQLGSRLLEDSERLYQMVLALRKTVVVPVLVKIRVDHRSGDNFNRDVALAIEAAGADAITVHGRHWTDDYDIAVSYTDIAQIKQSVRIPVIGNGDVYDTASARKMFLETGCDAIMIGRASVGQPWIFEQIAQELQGNTYHVPDVNQIGEIFLTHVQGLIGLEGEKIAILQSRKLGKYYARGFSARDRDVFLEKIHRITTYDDLVRLVNHTFSVML